MEKMKRKKITGIIIGLTTMAFAGNAVALDDATSAPPGAGPTTFGFDKGPVASSWKTASCPSGEDCPDVEPLSTDEVRELRDDLNARPQSDRTERGAQRVEDKETGERRNVVGNEAGRGNRRSFTFRKPPKGTTRVATIHSHPGKEYDKREHASGNAPSEDDQAVLHISNKPVIVVGPNATTQLYRRDGQDYLQVIDGDMSDLPSEEELAEQDIIICQSGNDC